MSYSVEFFCLSTDFANVYCYIHARKLLPKCSFTFSVSQSKLRILLSPNVQLIYLFFVFIVFWEHNLRLYSDCYLYELRQVA